MNRVDKKTRIVEGNIEPIQPEKRPFIHPLSASCLIALDALSGGGEILATPTGAGVLVLSMVVGFVMFIAGTTIEAGVNKKPLGEALGIGITLGILAGVPYPIAGTATGLAVLGWSGLKRLTG